MCPSKKVMSMEQERVLTCPCVDARNPDREVQQCFQWLGTLQLKLIVVSLTTRSKTEYDEDETSEAELLGGVRTEKSLIFRRP